jgi:hypothetical protein
VGNAIVALVFGESNVVGSSTAPYFVALPREGGLPDSEMMTAGHHGDGLGHLVAEILFSPEQIQRAHGHCQVILIVIGLHNGVENGFLIVGIGDVPGGGVESRLHIFLRPDDHEVHHVALILELVVDPARQAVDALAELSVERSVRHFQRRRLSRDIGSGRISRGCCVGRGGPWFTHAELSGHEHLCRR